LFVISLFYDRRSTAVKAFTRKLCLAFVTMGMLGVTGCGPDNEAEGQKASAKLGDPGKADPKSLPETKIVPPKSNAERKPGPMIGMPAGKKAAQPAPK
jgi:hypothetical protein